MSRFFKVVGHRGMPSRYPENTLPSFKAAIEAGVDAIEFDVHPTCDGRLVVTHDDTLERCSNGSGPVHDRTLAELRKLDFGSWKGAAFVGTQIPVLEEVLDLACAMSDTLELLIELKEDDERCALAVLEEITRRGILDRVVILSFYANLLKQLHEREPRLRLQGFPLKVFARPEQDAYEWLFRLCLWRQEITREEVDAFHARGIEVDVCPVDSGEDLEAIRNLEVDTVTTNAADVLMPLLRESGLRPAPLPREYTAWRLHGSGLDQLLPERLPLPEPAPGEILVRIDAVGLCFSDIKIIRAGANHPKLNGRDLHANPLTPGHEAVMTIVKTGSAVPLRYAPGQRFLIQCDIYVNSRSCAYGYAMNGAYAQYGVIDERVWRGEGRSYLLDFPETLSCVATALIEPWSCVRGSYGIEHRNAPRPRGRTLIGTITGADNVLRAGELFRTSAPGEIAAFGLSEATVRSLEKELGREVTRLTAIPAGEEFDDVVCWNVTDPGLAEALAGLAGAHGIVNFLGKTPSLPCRIDVGALHYRNRYYQGAPDGEISALYRRKRRTGLLAGGNAWFIGGAGAMGQMHVELAISGPESPSRILVTDLDAERLEHLKRQLSPQAAAKGIDLKFLNPAAIEPERFTTELHSFAPEGFDDAVILVPSAALVEEAAGFLRDGALVNVFAGIPTGESALLDLAAITERGIRYTGSSGSSFDDMAETLRLAAAGEFHPERALAAIGGMNALKKGLEAVAAGRFPGKTAILPNCPDLPLTAIADLGKLDPELAATLDESGCYTIATEAALIRKWGKA